MKKILVFRFEEAIGGYDANEIKRELDAAAKKLGFEIILIPHVLVPVSPEALKKFIIDLKRLK